MVDFLAEQKVNILLCIGGDGTLRGAQEIAKEYSVQRSLKSNLISQNNEPLQPQAARTNCH